MVLGVIRREDSCPIVISISNPLDARRRDYSRRGRLVPDLDGRGRLGFRDVGDLRIQLVSWVRVAI
jgi:hypothetical protein